MGHRIRPGGHSSGHAFGTSEPIVTGASDGLGLDHRTMVFLDDFLEFLGWLLDVFLDVLGELNFQCPSHGSDGTGLGLILFWMNLSDRLFLRMVRGMVLHRVPKQVPSIRLTLRKGQKSRDNVAAT